MAALSFSSPSLNCGPVAEGLLVRLVVESRARLAAPVALRPPVLAAGDDVAGGEVGREAAEGADGGWVVDIFFSEESLMNTISAVPSSPTVYLFPPKTSHGHVQ